MTKLASHNLPCPVIFICTAHGERRDIMTATAMFISEQQSTLCLSLAKDHLTAELIEASGRFTVALAGPELAELVWKAGGSRGEEKDKFQALAIETHTPEGAEAPVPVKAAGWMQCQVKAKNEVDDQLLFYGTVTASAEPASEPLVWYQDRLHKLSKL